jgi:hypothetical protein
VIASPSSLYVRFRTTHQVDGCDSARAVRVTAEFFKLAGTMCSFVMEFFSDATADKQLDLSLFRATPFIAAFCFAFPAMGKSELESETFDSKTAEQNFHYFVLWFKAGFF